MRLKHFLSVFLTLLTLSVGQMWGADQTYTLVSDISTITSSDKILIVSFNGDSKYYALKNNEVTTAGNLAAVEVSITSNTITADLETDYTWVAEYKDNTTISNTSYRRYYFKSTKGNYYLQYGNANNVKCKITSKASTDGLNYWVVGYTGVNSTNSVTGLWNENSSRMFACYTSDFRAYASSNFGNINGHDVYIYKKASATTPSLSRDPASLNWNTVNKGTELSTKTFTISGSNLTGNLSVSATGGYSVSCGSSITVTNGAPSVTSITVTPPSTSTAGTKNGTITISGGGASSVSVSCSLTVNEIDQFIDDVQNTSGYTPENPHIEAGSYGTTPSLSHKTATTSGTCEQQHYHFIGWITAAKYEAGTSIADGDIQAPTSATGATYYAVWAKGTSGGEVFDHYEKVTTAPTDWTAYKYVYATADAGYVLTGKGEGNYGAYTTMSTTTEMASYEITVENGSTDNYKLKQGGKYISCSSFGNLYWNDSYTAKTSSVNNGDWMFYKPSGTAFRIESPVKNSNNKWIYIDFNTSANPKRFNSYVSGNQTAVYLYKRVTTTAYTYFDYIAKCCTELGSINGSVSCTQTGATLTWDKKDNAEWEVSYKVKGAQGDPSTANVGDIDEKQDDNTKLQCSITELEPGTDYEFYVYAVAEGYCEEEKTWKIEGSTDASFTIIAQSNNESYGTVLLNGTTITGDPAQYCTYATTAYTVSPANSATVSQNGNAFNVTPAANCTITINFAPIAVTSVELNSNAETLEYNGTVTLTPTVSPDGANPGVTWESSDPTVATVSNGTVTATQKAGTTIITCKSSAYPAQLANCTITVVPVTEYKKVTANLDDWSGEYLLVYENSETDAWVYTGVDAANNYATATISNNKISKPAGGAKLTIASMEGGYSIRLECSGTNNGKYLSGTSGSNTTNFDNDASANTLGYSTDHATITSNTSNLTFNSADNNLRFRYFKSTSTMADVQLYRKVVTSAVTITAPATGTGSLTLADGQTAVASGDNIEAGTQLTVTATPNGDNHYIGGTIVVKKTSDESVVTNLVLDGTTLTMPEYGITVSATFTPTYAIAAATGITGGSFNWEETTGHTTPGYAAAGTQIQATANAANGYVFDAYDIYKTGASATKVSHTNGLFTMPAYAVTIGGSFNEAPTITLSQTSTMAFSKVATGTSTSAKFTVSAANLTAGNLSVTKGGTNPDKFGLSVSSIDVTDGAVSNAEVTVTPVTTATGDFTATIIVDDGNDGAVAQSFNVTLHVEDQYTINWYVNGTEVGNRVKSQEAFANDDLDIPNADDLAPFTDCSEFIFLGWKDGSAIDDGSSTSAPTLADVGTKVAASKNYYAVFGDGSPAVDESDSWNLETASDDWTGVNTTEYFSKPYGIKKANAYIVNSSISDFENYANNADEINIAVTCLQNGSTSGRLTIYLVDENGDIITGTGKEITPANANQLSGLDEREVTYNASEVNGKDATGYMVKCTTFDKNILISATGYEITKAEKYTKYYTTCPQIKNVVLSAATVSHGSISFKVGGKAATNVRTEEDDVVVDIVATPETGYELTGISLSSLSGASYNSTTGKIELAQNTNGTLTVTATFEETDYIVTLNHTEGVEPTMTGDTEEAHYGGTINLTTTIPSNAIFVNWTSSDVTITNPTSATGASFTMPAKNVTVTANFERLYTVAEALALVPEAGDNSDYVYVGGLISYVDETSWDANFKNISYYISGTGARENELLVFRGYKGDEKETFDDITDIKAGDKVVVYGKLTNYQGTKEFAQNNKDNIYSYIYQFTEATLSSITVAGTPVKTDYFANEDFTREGLTATAVYSNTGYSKDVTGTATWTNDLVNNKVTADGTVRVTATFDEVSGYTDIAVTVTTKTLESIELSETELTGYKGQALPKPTTVTAHFDDNGVKSTSDVTAFATIDGSSYDASSTEEQTFTVSYQFGITPAETADYTVTLIPVRNTLGTAYTVAKGREIIDIDNTDGNDLELDESANKVFVLGRVTAVSGNTYTIKDNTENAEFIEIYEGTLGTGISSVMVGDLIKVEGNLFFYENNTHTVQKYRITNGEIVVVVRTPNLTVADVAEMEVNITADLAEADLTIDKDGSNGDITFACTDPAVTIVNNKLHAAAAGDATVTATIAADGIYTAASTTFNVHVIAERTRYAITMDANGGSGTDPDYAKQLEGATVDLPADNTYSKANSAFAGWVVNDGAVEITDGHFTMPAAAVTIKATWNDVETCHISFQVSGGEVATADAPQAVAYSLAEVAHPTVDGFTFLGWSETEYDEETTTLPTMIESYTPALNQESKTLYGIYSQVVGGASNKHYVLDYADDELADVSFSYNEAADVTATDGSEWVIKASKQQSMQINNNKGAYIKVPDCPANIVQIVLTCRSGATNTAAFSETSDGNALVTATGTTTQTLDLSEENVSAGYIIPYSGNCQITHIDVEYSGNVTYYTSSPITRYTITYAKGDATGVSGLCEAQRKAAGTINLCGAPTCADKNFAKWSDGTSLYDAGAEYTLSADVTFTATWTPKPKYTVTYTANGGTGTAPAVEEYMEGETVTVKENTYFSKPGFDYDGWLIVYNNGVSDQEITPENGEFEMVAYNVTIKAKWAEESKQKWALVTDVADLKAGDKYIIAASGYNVAMAGQNENNRAQTAVVKRNEGAQLKGTSSMQVITLEGTTGAWEFNTGAGYLYAASSSNNHLKTQAENDANGKWTITISEGVASITATGSNTRNQLKYNSGSKIFSCYGSGQQTVALYKEIPMTVINDNSKDQDDVPDGGDMTIKEDKTWTVSSDKEVGDLYMEDGAIIANSAKVEANDLYFKTKKGKSNQIVDASQLNVIGDLYYDVQLCDGDLDADYWYSIAVPFDVDLNSGVFQADGSPMTNRVDFEVWGYDTQLRAQTQSNGWKRVNDNMMHAGKAYLIGFNPGQTNTIRLKAAANWKTNLFNGTSMQVVAAGSGDHANWNGLANPTMRYIDVNKKTEVFNNNTHEWDSYDPEALSFNFVVGTAFFVQSDEAVTISNTDHGNYRAPKRVNETKCAYAVRITREEATDFDNQIIVRASEEATGEYTQGHDMLTMNGTSSNTAALLWTENYGGKRLAIEEAAWLNGTASYVLKMFAPAAGTYSISVAEAKANADLYLTYEGNIIWNLSESAYPIDLKKGTTEGYGLLLNAKAPGAATGVDNIDASEAAQKVIINDHVYILRNGQMYGVDGKAVK